MNTPKEDIIKCDNNIASHKKISEEFKAQIWYLINWWVIPNSILSKKTVEHFVWYYFEKLVCSIFWWERIDEFSKIPDIRSTIDWELYHFEVKAAEIKNWIWLKLNQLRNFEENYSNSYWILVYYSCPNPRKTFKTKWPKWFLQDMSIKHIIIIPISILKEFYIQSDLSERDKKKYSNSLPYDTFKKTFYTTLLKFIVENYPSLNIIREWKVIYGWIDLQKFHKKFNTL